VNHNHCKCPETGNAGDFAAVAMGSSADHEHCKDFVTISKFTVPSKNTVRQSIYKILPASFVQKPGLLIHVSVVGLFPAQGDDFSSFHMPLQTVILLA
jgi:hypothetical protein